MSKREIPRHVQFIATRNRWRASFTPPDEKPVTKSTFVSRAEAERWLDEQIKKLRSGQTFERSKRSVTFEQYAGEVFWPLDNVRSTTRATQEGLYRNYLLPAWGDRALRSITTEEIEMWRRSLAQDTLLVTTGKPMGVSTQRQTYWTFHKIIRSACGKRGYLDISPLPDESGLPSAVPKDVRPLEPHEITLLARHCDMPEMIYFLAYGGPRIAEACALRINDLDVENLQIRIDEQVRSNGELDVFLKRERSRRVVPIPPDVMAMLVAHIERTVGWNDPQALVFQTVRAYGHGVLRPGNFRANYFQKAAHACGLGRLDGLCYEGVTPHVLRHTAVSAWLDEGFSLDAVARFIGDTLDTTYSTYSHLFQSNLSDAAKRMNTRVRRGMADATVVPITKRRAG